MPTPGFVPLIGSSFDALAGQGQYWAQFNARQDAENIARANQQQQNWNNYLATLAQMDREEGRYLDQMGVTERNFIVNQGVAARREAEQARQFGIGVDLQREGIRAQERQWDFQQREKNRLEQQQADQIINAGKTLGPQYDSAAQSYDTARKSWQEIEDTISSKAHGLSASDLAGIPIQFNTKTLAFEPTMRGMTISSLPADQQAKVFKAQKDIDDFIKEKQGDKIKYDNALQDFQQAERERLAYGFQVTRNQDGTYSLSHPHPLVSSKTFPKMVKKAAADAAADARPFAFFSNRLGVTPEAQAAFNPPSPSDVALGSGSPASLFPTEFVPFTGGTGTAASLTPLAPGNEPPAAVVPPSPTINFSPQPGRMSRIIANPNLALARGAMSALGTPEAPPNERGFFPWMGQIYRAAAGPAPAVPPGRVLVMSPKGRVGTIPKEDLERALKSDPPYVLI